MSIPSYPCVKVAASALSGDPGAVPAAGGRVGHPAAAARHHLPRHLHRHRRHGGGHPGHRDHVHIHTGHYLLTVLI